MNGFIRSLLASGPAADRAAAMDTYGRLVGDWSFEAQMHADGGVAHVTGGEIHFGWVLDGRAIQDVWVLPGYFAGTTLRLYDPGLDAWHILWSDPLRQSYNRQIGRRIGERSIVQEGTDLAGNATRWSFQDITADRFRWLGERRGADGAWQLLADFAARRT